MNQRIIPGLVDNHLEIFKTKDRTYISYGGKTTRFHKAPEFALNILRQDLLLNIRAQAALDSWGITDDMERLERYASCRFGGIDIFPDIHESGMLKPDYHACPLIGTCPYEGEVCAKLSGPHGEITPREKEVLVNIAKGLMQKEIADEMGIEMVTVAKMRKSLFEKTGCDSSTRLTRFAYDHNLIPQAHAF